MTEFLRVLRYGTRREKREILKYAGPGIYYKYYKYGKIDQPDSSSKIIKKNQVQIFEYTRERKILRLIKIRYRVVILINPCFLYRCVYTMNGRLLILNGASL